MPRKMKTAAPPAPTAPGEWPPARVLRLRQRYQESQHRFGIRIGVTGATVSLWELGKGEPSGTAKKLLDRLADDVGLDG